jgi:hypothetical protein
MFDELAALANQPERLLEKAAVELAAAGELHRLFDLRLMQHRYALGLPLDRHGSIDDVEEPRRSQLESAYLAACREVGQLFLKAGEFRQAWMYLRPAGDKQLVRQQLAQVTLQEEMADELIELALFEGVDPERGYAWLLGKQGTCNGITTLDSLQHQLAPDDLRACAAVLLRHIYGELRGNLRGHLHRLQQQASDAGATPAATPPKLTVLELIDQYPELLAGGNYHLDVSHLASGIRYARLLESPEQIRQARELVAYGARLPQDLQYPGDPPFEEMYRAHALYFDALLGKQVDAAVEYFGKRGAASDFDTDGPAAVETLLTLLARVGREAEALARYADLVPEGRELSRLAPTPLQLAEASGAWEQYQSFCQSRNDVVGFAAGQLAAPRRSGAAR